MSDEEYNRKLEQLQQYIPFLDNMIIQLKDPNKKNREQQLNKMQSLHAMITDKRKKLKLETLVKCEDVISKLYEKVHNKPLTIKKSDEGVSSTPASPSPPRDVFNVDPLTIPTERLEESRIPKIDIYSSAGESLCKMMARQETLLSTKVPDMSKPPISIEDLKTLEDDVHDKIHESSLIGASLHELNTLKEKLTEQLQIEDILLRTPKKATRENVEAINTTVRNSLNLTRKQVQAPSDKSRTRLSFSSPPKTKTGLGEGTGPKLSLSKMLENQLNLMNKTATEPKTSPSKTPEPKPSTSKCLESKTSPDKFQELKFSPRQLQECKSSPDKLETKFSLDMSPEVGSSPDKLLETKSSPEKLLEAKSSPTRLLETKSSPCRTLELKSNPGKAVEPKPGPSEPKAAAVKLPDSGSTSKKEHKTPPSPAAKPAKILKEPDSIFGNILSHIDDQILEIKKKERRNSLTGKEEGKSDKDSKKKEKKHKDDGSKEAKKKERSNSTEDKSKDEKKKKSKESDSKKERHHHKNGDGKSKSKDEHNGKKEEKHKHSSKDKDKEKKDNAFSLSGKKSFEADEERLKKDIESKANVTKEKQDVPIEDDDGVTNKIWVKKDLVVADKEEIKPPAPTFRRLADKYNPKPRKPATEPDVDKEVSDIIEKEMKSTPPKIPVINQIPEPVPPPATLLQVCEPEAAASKLPPVLQTILTPTTHQLINSVVSQLKQNAEPDTRKPPLLPTPVPQTESIDNFVSEYTREDFTKETFSPNHLPMGEFNSFASAQKQRQDRLKYEAPPLHLPPNQFHDQRFMSPTENFSHPPARSFTPMPFAQPYNNFQPNQNPSDIQALDYYPPNAPIPSNQYNCGPPLLSPEIPHFHNEQKPVGFGMMPGHDPYDDMRWRQEENNRFVWERREQDVRMNRDPRTYREYREMREARDPRVAGRENTRDPRENTRELRENPRDPRENPRDPRENPRDPRENPRDIRENPRDPRTSRDPRVNREQSVPREIRDGRDFPNPRDYRERDRDPRMSYDRDRGRFRDGRSRGRDSRLSRFDRMYSRTNRDRSRSRSRYPNETFTSPLDSLYTGKEEHKTGKGYGVQNFRIPKIKKEDEDKEKEQSTKVSSTNEDDTNADVVHTVNEDSNDSTNEVTGNDVDADEDEENAIKAKETVNKDTESKVEEKVVVEEAESVSEEPAPKLDMEVEEANAVEAPKPAPEPEQAKPADQTILAQFFANLLGSQNKKQKKTALYSLISTFSDSFSEKELSKITKIIKADDDEADSSEEEEEAVKKPEPKPETEPTPELEKEVTPAPVEEEEAVPDSPVRPKRKYRRRVRRLSSTQSLKEEEEVEEEEEAPNTPGSARDDVVVTVGERIKSRKRTAVTPPKPKKKCKTELDMLHEDIQDMFIRDGVLTASGKRMCRILKGDPNALTSPQTEQKTRRKPGPKPKNAVVKTMRNIRILLPKIPDMEQKEEGTKRTLRSATRQSYAESDDDEVDNKSVATETESLPEVESESESSDEERDKSLQNADPTNKTKAVKRKRGKGWASGNIPSSKKKKKKQSLTEEAPATPDSVTPTEMDRSFIEPDKDYYIDFGWKKGHQCRLCDYHGKYITTHYKTEHPGSEILTSRFSPAVAKEAIEDSKKNLSRYESLVRKQGSGKIHFTCRFCAFNTTVPPTVFYDHITTHTGEYRHMCPMCDFSASSGKTLKSHMSSIHNDVSKRVARKTYSDTILFAYLCGECNYVQLSRQSVEEHVNIFHLQKPKIYKVNMSTVVDPEVGSVSDVDSKKEPVAKDETPSPKENVKAMLAPPVKKRMKPGPKCMKDRLKALEEKEESVSNTSTTESDVSVSSNAEVEAASPQSAPKAVAASRKRLVKEVSVPSEEDSTVVGGRSRRAAKDKATEKLKTLMEVSENSTRKKPVVVQPEPEDEGKKDVAPNAQAEQPVQEKKHRPGPKCKTEKKVEVTNIKKEVEMNVFTCKTDIQEENKKIEQERLQLMDELNKSVGSRTTLNFVDKLCNRLSNNDIMVKQEPRDEPVEVVLAPTPVPSVETDTAMPVLEENLPTKAAEVVAPPQQAKKPVLETEDIQVSNPSFDVTQKKDKIITDMIQKLKGKLADDQCQSPVEAETPPEADYDSEGPPPLTHVHELPNVKPADGSTKTLLIGGLVKVIKYSNSLMFSCLVPPCVFSTDNRDAFQKHCSEAHKQLESCTLCEICGMEITSTNECTLLESIFQHAFRQHSDFMNATPAPETPKPSTPVLRIRKLSGDALSIKKDWEDETDDASPVGSQKEDHEDGAAPSQAVAAPSTAVVDLSDDNPFPFKISGVMSLAESVPPLTPLVKSAPAPAPTPSPVQLIVKEAKLNNTELTKSRKTPKAMAKFISSVSDLYKCPHYYCLFSTNFRDFLERHLRAHKMEPELMIPCVYCDMKTPWEHVAMHIDIRHAHCRFACSYCLYRAVVKEYVFLHQDQMHPENDYSVIALPQPKNSKRWAIAEAKIEPKTLCDPYKCTPSCGVEFLFENEFRRHLNMKHKSNFIPCGYQNCLHRVQANKMPNHWGLNHSISVYQCGLCTANHNDIKKLYHHFATSHQGCQPNILIRINAEMEDSITLGYTAEAFNHLRRVVSIPSNVCENKTEAAPAETSTPIVLPNPVPYSLPSKTTLQIVPPLQQNPAQKSVLIPTSKSVLNHSITFVSTNSSTPGTGNIVFVPAVTNAFTGGIMVQQPSTSSSDKASDKTVNVVPSVPTVTTPTVLEIESAPVEDAPPVKDLAIEHVTVGDDAVQAVAAGDEAEAEVDPLSLDDADAFKSVADSSDDEADAAKTDKTKKCTKSGLLSYQLYRCAFCDISFSNSVDFKRHATYSATCREDAFNVKPFTCVHCAKQLKTPHMLVEHIQCHGILRFACSLCGNKFPNLSQTRSHMKIRHNITHTSVTPLNAAKQNPDTDEYVLRPKLNLQIVAVKEASAPESSASTAATEDVYTPDTIDKIPMRHILSSSARCGLCSYTTKVRTNMVRHLQFHSEEKAVPDTAPVNPVPCLEKNEKMFDKMVNLASSSHTGSRMGGGGKDPKEKETETFPEFVPSHCRYVCCAHNCSYMCPEEGNLRHHLIALHDGETSFTCVHCKTDLTPTDADSLLKHFKLHALQLYKCHYCSFIHNLKHKVEKHANDSHLDAPLKVITLRCMETEPKDAQEASTASNSQATPSTTTTGKIYKPWRCCMCKYKSGTLDGIQHHVLEKHEFDSQFKCALCSYKTDDTDTFTEHFKESHDNQAMDIIYAYRKLEEDNKEKEKEPEAFDTTPLWQRDRPRVRHIRGILFDESVPATKSPKKVKTAPAPSPGPSVSRSAAPSPGPSGVKSAAPSPGPSGVKNAVASPGSSGVRSVALPPGTSLLKTSTHAPTALDMCIESVVNGTADILREASSNISDDFFLTINKMMKDSNEDIAKVKDSMVIVIEDEEDHKTPTVKDKDNKNAPTAKNRPAKRKGVEVAGFGGKMQKVVDEVIDLESGVGNDDADQDEFGERSLKVQFGPMGVPQYRQYKCPVCAMFKSKRICDFVFHLFKEMKIFRFKCKVCSDESITYRYMYKHIRANHPNSDHKQNIIRLPPNLKLLTWLQMVLREQSIHITKSYPKIHVCAPPTFPNPVKCDFCEDKFKWEQDKNEHSVEHWMSKPFGCCLCGYTAYVKSDVETHFKAEHQDRVWIADENVTMKGPTVEKLLQISDDLHLREITERLEKEKGSLPAPPSKVEERVPQSLFCAESMSKEDDGALSDSDLIIVTKTDRDVPTESDVFCCEYCAYMGDSEMHVISHITAQHEYMAINFKKLNQVTCNVPKEYVGCMICSTVGSEVMVRRHHMEKHAGLGFSVYRFECLICPQKRFLKFAGLKVHFNKVHTGLPLNYGTVCGEPEEDKGSKTYRCPLCPYVRNFRPTALNNMRAHLKQHFKAFMCGICLSNKYKTRADVITHYVKEHPLIQDQQVVQDLQLLESYNQTMNSIIASATDVAAVAPKNTARKSTSAPHPKSSELTEYSFYGNRPEQVDLSKIKTSVEINGMHLDMSAEKLSKIFDLDVAVALEDCNLCLNMSNLFDS